MTQSAAQLGMRSGKPHPTLRASASMYEIGGKRGGALAHSSSLPAGALAAGIDGPTVGEGVDDGTADDDSTGPAMPSGLQPARARVGAKGRPWKKDKRCDPCSRFFEPPNLEHLMYAEEV